jgi:hypothetical protein
MALKRRRGSPGTLIVLEHTSKILKDNPLGDPNVRKLAVWLPPHYDEVLQTVCTMRRDFGPRLVRGMLGAHWRWH